MFTYIILYNKNYSLGLFIAFASLVGVKVRGQEEISENGSKFLVETVGH